MRIDEQKSKKKKRKEVMEEDGEGRVSLHIFDIPTIISYPDYINFSVQSPSESRELWSGLALMKILVL